MTSRMFSSLLFAQLALSAVSANATACTMHVIVGCLTSSLSNYSLSLYRVTRNLAQFECDTHDSISSCWAASTGCSIQDAKRAADVVMDVMSLRNTSSSFLYGVLALDPICEAHSKSKISKHSACLKKFHEGEHMLKSMEGVFEHVEEKKPGLCAKLTEVGGMIQKAAKSHCTSAEVGHIMCKAAVNPFTVLHPDQLPDCPMTKLCPEPKVEKVSKPGSQASQNGKTAKKSAHVFAPTPALILTLLLALRVKT